MAAFITPERKGIRGFPHGDIFRILRKGGAVVQRKDGCLLVGISITRAAETTHCGAFVEDAIEENPSHLRVVGEGRAARPVIGQSCAMGCRALQLLPKGRSGSHLPSN